jgi:hypothetical protein
MRVLSQESGIAPFETLFHEFDLAALPHYNFWEKDEETSTHVRGAQDPDDLPRYIHLYWTKAPTVPDPNQYQKLGLAGAGDPSTYTSIAALPAFGLGSNSAVGVTAGGISFTPEYLQPSHFPQSTQIVSNGQVFAGMLEAVVSQATSTLVVPMAPSSSLVDEDQYLSDYTTWEGIPFSEFNATLWRRNSTLYGVQQMLGNLNLSPAGNLLFQGLFQGQFGISPSLNQVMNIQSVSPNAATISVFAQTAVADREQPVPRILELADPLLSAPVPSDKTQSIKVKFIHTNILGMMTSSRISTVTQAHEGESIAALAPLAGNLAVYAAAGVQSQPRHIQTQTVPAPATIRALQYIGYVIEKWELIDGSYELNDIIYIPGVDFTDYVDAAIKYGSSYRYRIKTILQWCRERGLDILGVDPTTNPSPGSQINSLTPNDISYFESEWGADWAYAQVIDREPPDPPDELIVQPNSIPDPTTGLPYVIISFRIPYNPQRDISSMTLFRKVQDASGNDMTGWVQMQEFKQTLSDSSRQGSKGQYAKSYQHEQDDITGRKFGAATNNQVATPVIYGPVNARFEDHNVTYWGTASSYRYVYAAMTYNRHGEESVLSDQLGVRLNPNWKKAGEFPVDFVSCAGINMDLDVGLFNTYPERRLRSEIIFKADLKSDTPGVVSVEGQQRRAAKLIQGANYILRVESLDVGQHIDVPVTLTLQNLPALVNTQSLPPLVPSPG